MANFQDTDFGFSKMSLAEIQVVVEKGGILGSIGYGYSTCGSPEPRHGWRLQWINRQGMGNHGTAVVVPDSIHARKFWREVKKKELIHMGGLTPTQAEKFLSARTQYKWELIGDLTAALADQAQLMAAAAYPGYGAGSGRRQWVDAWSDPWSHLSKPRESSLVELIKALV
jgi:hypothetical protein